jgi:hypothetical protein
MMKWTFVAAVAVSSVVTVGAGCRPELTAPRESFRLSGTVKGEETPLPVEVNVYERCTPQLYVFRRCPGKFLGEAKIARPGPFLVEIDTQAPEISVVASRGVIGEEEECSVLNLPLSQVAKPVELTLAKEPCPVKREAPY